MNLLPQRSAIISRIFRFWLILRRLMPRQKCQAFAVKSANDFPRIDKIYVINLDRAPRRWLNMKQELNRILDYSKTELLNLTERYVAVDAKEFTKDPIKDAKVDPFYTLSDQLFVEPQPLTLPTQLELDQTIEMSRAECAVARSHINVWEQVAAGDNEHVLILEDDVWFHSRFAKDLDDVWKDLSSINNINTSFDVLYLSYYEVKNGAPKTILSNNLFRPVRGLWHLSGYVLSREGAKKLIRLLPSRGPIDLWINHHFKDLNVFASKQSLISQRRDIKSSNSYSILPALTTIGAITSEGASLFNIRPTERPIFAFGHEGSGQTSLGMALSMLGYRCCSDFEDLPNREKQRLFEGSDDRVFDAYVNIGSLNARVGKLKAKYPKAKFILTRNEDEIEDVAFNKLSESLEGADIAILHTGDTKKWRIICEHLVCAPPSCSYPKLKDVGQRPILDENTDSNQDSNLNQPKHDGSPWIIASRKLWQGINSITREDCPNINGATVKITDTLEFFNSNRWLRRSDTFTDNLALFRPSNTKFVSEIGATLLIKEESLGVRDFSAASISSKDQYLFGKFEATIQASNVPGVVTGFFLHRNSPRQEIDIEVAGNRPNRLLINVFYNPGDVGANFDYGYRGSPSHVDLGFDASKESHRYAIEWKPNEIRWLVDDKLVHRRVVWDPTPIPHLPMTLHANNWVTRSTELAGRIYSRNLPTVSIFRKIQIEANIDIPDSEVNASSHRKLNKLT
ncbi:family 16 glycosylhydrolase [Maribacter sp. ANRC-HE7]|uniref:Beta-glucanase n=1 Tax=Maribacter aquimaris TaxID=2737171 RepID=A0ABR7V850_9FLAO|nr:family 16 glycosylhydrolase [Maribacter aquimaris]MBD0780094.1 family 16 glycosylhydrolase [Maribacter aquimaris]